ncbi:MAG: thiamine pyrophosphate-dependent enzyme, partial [Candidatus Methylumidiphilus sp.]
EELSKPNLKPDLCIISDARNFIEDLLSQASGVEFTRPNNWLEACQNWKRRYPLVSADFYADQEHVNSYVFADILSDLLTSDDLIVCGNSLDVTSIYQSFRVTKGQRVFTNINFGAMGWDLPGALGASVAADHRRTVLVTGDGSLQFNIQELQTVSYYRRNLKIFVLNNKGYSSIRTTQNTHFAGNLVGSDEHSGVSNPNFGLIAQAYGLHYSYISTNAEVKDKASAILAKDGPALCELNISYDQMRIPRVSSARREDGTMETRPLEDMYPFLPREEIWDNMHIFDDDN